MSVKSTNTIDLNTLNLLPVALIIFDNTQVYFINSLAKNFFKVPLKINLEKEKVSLYNFLDKSYHDSIKKNTTAIIKGKNFPPVELEFTDYKKNKIFVEAKSNRVWFNNKWVVQSTFLPINERINKYKNYVKAHHLLVNLGTIPNEVIYELKFFPKPHISYISNNVKSILNKTPEEIYKNPLIFKKFVHKDDQKNYVASFKEYTSVTKRLNNAKTVEYRFYRTRNQIIYLENKHSSLFDADKNLIGFIGTITDITERKETEILLNETKEKFELITNNSKDIISLYTYYPKEKYIYVSPNIKNLLGNKADELYKDYNFFSKRALDYSNDFKKIDRELKLNQKKNVIKNYCYRYKTKHKNGTILWLENSLTPILNENKKIISYLNVYRDITEQYQKEQQLLQEKQNYQSLLDITPIAYLIHKDGKFLFGNNSLLNLLGIKNIKELIGKSVLTFLNPSSKTHADKRLKEIKTGKNISNTNFYSLTNAKNKQIDVETITTKIQFNKRDCFLTLIKNITLEKELELQRIKTQAILVNNKKLESEIKIRTATQLELAKTTAQLTSIFENTNHLMWTLDKKFKVKSFNKNYSNLIYKLYNHKLKVGDVISDIITNPTIKKEFLNIWSNHLKNAFKGEKIEFTRVNSYLDLSHRIYMFPIYNSGGIVSEVSCLAIDITKEVVIQDQLVKQSAKLNAIFESGEQSMWTVNKNYVITSHNKNYVHAIKTTHGINIDLKSKTKFIDPVVNEKESKAKKTWLNNYEKAFNGKATEFLSERISPDGKSIIRQVYLHPIYNKNGVVTEVSGICYDITHKKIADQKLLNQAAKLTSIFDSSHHYVWTIDRDHKLTSFNKNYFDLIETVYNTMPYVGLKLDRGILSNDTHYTQLLDEHYKRAFSGNSTTFEIETKDKNHNRIYLQVFLNPVYHDDEKTINEVSGIAYNITEKKLIQQNIEQSLKEKEILLKEVHHRVKNNMQVISSILNLQTSYSNDPNTISILKESQNRIKTMAYIHESLYQNKTFTSVNFSDYINTLANNIIQSYSINENHIKLKLEIEKINLTLDNSIPAGLIINELLSNAIKHAFLPNVKGEILVSLKTSNKTVHLSVIDTGQGFSSMIDFYNSPSLGLQLVNTLVEQLDGQINFESKQGVGTKIFISFNM